MRKPLVDTPADIPVNTPADAPVSAWLALGGNLGNAQQNVLDAIESISRTPHISLQAASSLYRSPPFEASGPDFINAVVQVSTTLAPHALLAACAPTATHHARWISTSCSTAMQAMPPLSTPPHSPCHTRACTNAPSSCCHWQKSPPSTSAPHSFRQ